MGLLELLQQGQTQLSAGSFPGDAPINDPQSGFIQDNSPTHTYYEDETVGQPNNGSKVISTLVNTGLDNTITAHDINKPTPILSTNYPELVSGEFNGAPSSPISPYRPYNTYLNSVPIQTPDSPQIPTLSSSSLDNTGSNASTTIIPNSLSYPNNYPEIEGVNLGALNGAPSDYQSPYNTDNTYLQNVSDDINSIDVNILGQTGLDNYNLSSAQTAITPNNLTYPNNYPGLVSGEFNGAPSLSYETPYNNINTYLSNVPIQNISSPQSTSLNQTGLDNTNTSAEPTATTPNSISAPNHYPALVSGEFNGAPSQYESPYNANYTYLGNMAIQDTNSPQNLTLGNTGLDNTNPSTAPSAIIPNDISYPNHYPALVSGEFNGAPSQYTSSYNSENPYLNSISIQDPNSPQIPTLGETGLDLDNSEYFPTAMQPSSIAYPNNYPAIEGVNLGGFGGPEQYDTNWNQDNTYFNNFNPDSDNSIQLAFTGSNLDNSSGTNVSTLSHVIPPLSIYKPNNYPIIPHVYLGEFNSSPSQYVTPYNSASSYLGQYDELKNETTNPQINTLDETGLDVENSDALITSLLFAPTNPDNITTYPTIVGVNLGVTGSGAQGFNQVYKPSNTYWNNYLTNRSLFDTLTA
jgi:hypothetical protein